MNRRFTDGYEELTKQCPLIAVAFSEPRPQGAISGRFFRGTVCMRFDFSLERV
jgi:hypothetical protein